MPLYEFTCSGCGPFDLVRRMDESAAPATCPSCGGAARRVYSPPGVALLARPVRRALDVQEKSAHEPAVVGERKGRPMPHLHHHAPSPPWVMSHH